jgi:hypothetical protein
MHTVSVAAALGFLFAATTPLFADDIDATTLEKVRIAASKGYAHSEAATIKNVKKSLAINGSGYCGEINIEDTPDTVTTFHVILETPTGPRVLRLIDFKNPETDPQAKTVHEIFLHFGCITE